MDLKDTIEVKSGLYITKIVKMPDGKTVTMLQPNPNLTEEEFLSKDPYAELLEETSKKENFDKAVTTQKMVNEYLMSNNRSTITEKRAKEGKRDILGIVTSDYKAYNKDDSLEHNSSMTR